MICISKSMEAGERLKPSQIELKNISFGYTEELVLEDINMKIEQGDYVGIVGPNGAAKSTLLKLMVGTLKPKSGSVELFGTPIQRFKGWNEIGYVSQRVRDFNLSFPATVAELISASIMDRKGLGVFSKNKKERIREILSIVGMEEFQNAKIGELSGGQQQRIFIARALANNPKILLLDEPTVGVDVASQVQFYNLLEKLNQELKLTLVMVSHDLGVIAKKANVIACIANKQLVLHDNHSFQHSEYIQLTYGEGVELLTHQH